jgi:DNA-binding transcriptional ArsR family regulator
MALNELFLALSDPTRRQILRLLREGDLSAGEIAEHFELARSTLSGHFNVLKHAGLIVQERLGTTIVYSLNVSALEEAVATVMDALHTGSPKRRRRRP